MLIVIVIIGILAATILPNLMGARDKANDTARQSALRNMVAPLMSYAGDHGEFPNHCGDLSGIQDKLAGNIKSIPVDPSGNKIANGFLSGSVNTTTKQYGYCNIEREGNPNGSYVLVAKVSDPNKGNWNSNTSKDGNIAGKKFKEIREKVVANESTKDFTGDYLVVAEA